MNWTRKRRLKDFGLLSGTSNKQSNIK